MKFLHEKDEELSQNLQNEYELLHSLSHPNIISVKELILLETSSISPLVMAMEYLESYIPLQSFIEQAETPLSSQQILNIFSQICNAITYLHDCRVAHRDLHISNVLIHPETHQIKLIDFGLAKKQSIFSKSMGSFSLLRLQQETFELNTPTGIPCFRAPEAHKQNSEGDSLKADIWMLGLLLLALSIGEYLTTATILKRFREFESGACEEFDEKIGRMLRGMLRKEPSKRLSAKNLLEMVEKAWENERREWFLFYFCIFIKRVFSNECYYDYEFLSYIKNILICVFICFLEELFYFKHREIFNIFYKHDCFYGQTIFVSRI